MKKLVDKQKALENISKKGKVDISKLETELNDIMSQMAETPDKENLALRELNRRYSGPPDKTKKIKVCVFGLFNLTDFNAKALDEAMKKYATDPTSALEQGYVKIVDGKPEVLDLKKTFGNNIENKNYGKPLGHSWNRKCLALVSADGTEWSIGKLVLRGEFGRSKLPEMFKVLDANLLEHDSGELRTAQSTKFEASGDTIDYNGLLTTLAKDKIVILGDAFTEAQSHTKDEPGFYDRYILTSGEFKYINDPKNEGGNFNGTLDDFTLDEMISAFVDGALVKPETGKEYTLICQSSIRKKTAKNEATGKWEKTDEEQVMLNVLGYYS